VGCVECADRTRFFKTCTNEVTCASKRSRQSLKKDRHGIFSAFRVATNEKELMIKEKEARLPLVLLLEEKAAFLRLSSANKKLYKIKKKIFTIVPSTSDRQMFCDSCEEFQSASALLSRVAAITAYTHRPCVIKGMQHRVQQSIFGHSKISTHVRLHGCVQPSRTCQTVHQRDLTGFLSSKKEQRKQRTKEINQQQNHFQPT